MTNTEINFWKNKFEDYLKVNPLDDGSHDLSHFQRVWSLANRFATSSADKLTILASCYFHDIVNYPKNDLRRSQSSKDAAVKAKEILKDMDFPLEKLENVAHCIEAHSFSAGIEPETIEAMIVQDADRMESLGAIGLARTFYTAGRLNSQLFDENDPFAKSRELDDRKFAVDHFELKLLKLPATMKTQAGKIEAIKRAGVLEAFLSDLKNELKL